MLDHPPADFVHIATFLANKTEDVHCSLSQFCRLLQLKDQSWSKLELTMLHWLNSDLVVYHAYTPLRGFLFAMRHGGVLADDAAEEALTTAAHAFIRRTLLTDASLLHTPSQVALAAVLHAADNTGAAVETWVKSQFGGNEAFADLLHAVHLIRGMVTELDDEKDAQATPLLVQKLLACRNPMYDPSSDVYKARVHRLKQEEAARRDQMVADAAAEQKRRERELLGGGAT